MERTVEVDGRTVKFRASAAIPRAYRVRFGRDMLSDMTAIKKEYERAEKAKKAGRAQEGTISVRALTLFENVAFLMAKHADPAVPETVEEWLDGFETFSIYRVFPVISELWAANMQAEVRPRKK